MRKRCIERLSQVSNTGKLIKVSIYRISETDEYLARGSVNGTIDEPSDYFTNDKQDAIETARTMLNWYVLNH